MAGQRASIGLKPAAMARVQYAVHRCSDIGVEVCGADAAIRYAVEDIYGVY